MLLCTCIRCAVGALHKERLEELEAIYQIEPRIFAFPAELPRCN